MCGSICSSELKEKRRMMVLPLFFPVNLTFEHFVKPSSFSLRGGQNAEREVELGHLLSSVSGSHAGQV